jgi:hypothetical protein
MAICQIALQKIRANPPNPRHLRCHSMSYHPGDLPNRATKNPRKSA